MKIIFNDWKCHNKNHWVNVQHITNNVFPNINANNINALTMHLHFILGIKDYSWRLYFSYGEIGYYYKKYNDYYSSVYPNPPNFSLIEIDSAKEHADKFINSLSSLSAFS